MKSPAGTQFLAGDFIFTGKIQIGSLEIRNYKK